MEAQERSIEIGRKATRGAMLGERGIVGEGEGARSKRGEWLLAGKRGCLLGGLVGGYFGGGGGGC